MLFPALLAERGNHPAGPALHRMHRRARFLYTAVLSPAAIIAIASGTALIFLREVYVPWFAAKLLLVAGLAMIHVFAASRIVELFKEEEPPRYVLGAFAFAATTVLVAGTLTLVLAKPNLPMPGGPGTSVFTPGGLGDWLAEVFPALAPVGAGGETDQGAGVSVDLTGASSSASGELSDSGSSSSPTSPTP
ncbi:hypothetical protein GCM10011341_33460 [Frigidibacter albus]|nr:hypothetical protein GCM10011341_33460 [Frigidibacter albus]